MLTPFVKAILCGCGAFKSKEIRLCERNGNTFTLNSYYIYLCSCFHFIVNEISRNKTKNCPRRLTAVELYAGVLGTLVPRVFVPLDQRSGNVRFVKPTQCSYAVRNEDSRYENGILGYMKRGLNRFADLRIWVLFTLGLRILTKN